MSLERDLHKEGDSALRKVFIGGCSFDPLVFGELKYKLESRGILVQRQTQEGVLCEEELKRIMAENQVYVLGGEEKITEGVLESARNLKLIVFLGVEAETFFTPGAWKMVERGKVKVETTPGANTEAVSEFTALLALEAARKAYALNRDIQEGRWGSYTGIELAGKRFGIIGGGNIGGRVGEIMHGFGMEVIYWSRHRKLELEEKNIIYQELDDLLHISDIVSLHLALTPETRHFLNERRLALMRKDALLINAARADLVDPIALFHTLKHGSLRGVAFDGFYIEGKDFEKRDKPLHLLDRIFVTPHQAFNTEESNLRASQKASEIIYNFFENETAVK